MLTLAEVEAAAAAIAGSVVRTPSTVSQTLSDVLGCTVIVKFENLQFVASFKERGARNKLLSLTDAERAGGRCVTQYSIKHATPKRYAGSEVSSNGVWECRFGAIIQPAPRFADLGFTKR